VHFAEARFPADELARRVGRIGRRIREHAVLQREIFRMRGKERFDRFFGLLVRAHLLDERDVEIGLHRARGRFCLQLGGKREACIALLLQQERLSPDVVPGASRGNRVQRREICGVAEWESQLELLSEIARARIGQA
jgi:hypothetical protein